MSDIRNALISLGAFIALSHQVKGWVVFIFIMLLWNWDYKLANLPLRNASESTEPARAVKES